MQEQNPDKNTAPELWLVETWAYIGLFAFAFGLLFWIYHSYFSPKHQVTNNTAAFTKILIAPQYGLLKVCKIILPRSLNAFHETRKKTWLLGAQKQKVDIISSYPMRIGMDTGVEKSLPAKLST